MASGELRMYTEVNLPSWKEVKVVRHPGLDPGSGSRMTKRSTAITQAQADGKKHSKHVHFWTMYCSMYFYVQGHNYVSLHILIRHSQCIISISPLATNSQQPPSPPLCEVSHQPAPWKQVHPWTWLQARRQTSP